MKQLIFLLSLLFLFIFSSCTDPKKTEERLITVTIEPQRFFVEQLAGDKFKVVTMVPKGSNPETYDPTPQQLVSLGNSEAYMRIGYIGFELAWLDKLTDNAPHIQMFDTSKGIDLILDQHHHCQSTDHAHQFGGVEPHVWSSAPNAIILVENTRRALSKLDKENEELYTARADSLKKEIMAVDVELRTLLKGGDKSFMIYHPALSYFARDYGLQQISIEEGGKEPSPAHLKDLIDLSKKEKVKVVFVQQEFDLENAKVIANETGAIIVPINPLSYNWKEELLSIAHALKATQ